jgi:hypothetical protein
MLCTIVGAVNNGLDGGAGLDDNRFCRVGLIGDVPCHW